MPAYSHTLRIRVSQDRPAGLSAGFNVGVDGLCISTIVLTELLVGAGKSGRPAENRREVERFAARLAVLPFNADAADIRAVLERQGCGIGAYE